MKNYGAGLIRLLSIVLAVSTLAGCSSQSKDEKKEIFNDVPSISISDEDVTKRPIVTDKIVSIPTPTPTVDEVVDVQEVVSSTPEVTVETPVIDETKTNVTLEDVIIYNGDLTEEEIEQKLEEYADMEGPCILIDPENVVFGEIPNDNYDEQVRLVTDLGNLDTDNQTYLFFSENVTKEELYSLYGPHIEVINLLKNHGGTPDKIVWEFNNLYVLSQTPSCMPIEAWVHYFGLMDSAMTEEEYSLYEKYIETINFVHNKALSNSLTLEK